MKVLKKTSPSHPKADICVVGGAGHVGLPLSIVLAQYGHRVLVYDIDRKALETINQGKMPMMEKGAEPLLHKALAQRRLITSSHPSDMKGVPVIIITIGTPVDEFQNPILKNITQCMEKLVPWLFDGQLLILRSTVYPGVTAWVSKYLHSKGKMVKVAFCPERIVQGFAIEELQELPQIVSGTTPEAENAAAQLFRRITQHVVRLSPTEAEFVKLFSNAYRYIHFAISNQFYMMTTTAGVDYYRVLEGMKKNYPRIGDVPKAGFSAGPCLYKDTMQLMAFCRNQFSLGQSATLINEGLPLFVVDQIQREHELEKLTVGLLGMAFKADIDDPRSSLSYKLKKILTFRARRVLTTDPYVKDDPELLPLKSVLEESDIIILGTPHRVYESLDLQGKIVVDPWNFWPRSKN